MKNNPKGIEGRKIKIVTDGRSGSGHGLKVGSFHRVVRDNLNASGGGSILVEPWTVKPGAFATQRTVYPVEFEVCNLTIDDLKARKAGLEKEITKLELSIKAMEEAGLKEASEGTLRVYSILGAITKGEKLTAKERKERAQLIEAVLGD